MTNAKQLIQSVTTAFQQAKQLTTCDRETLDRTVEQALDDLFARASSLSFWKERLDAAPSGRGYERLRNLPVLKRQDIQEEPERFRIRIPGSTDAQYSISETSGSTGKPVNVLKYRPAQTVQSGVLNLLLREWAQVDVTQNYAKLRSATDEKANDSWGFPYTLLGKTGRSLTFDINVRKASGILEELVNQQIGYIHGNVTLVRAIAMEAKDSQLREGLALKKVFTWAERVFQEDRELVKEILGVDIWDIYSSEELGAIALQCPNDQHLHVLPFRSIVEILDDDDQPCEIGQTGRVVVTTLRNPVQPLIRYELGDLAKFQEPCESFPNLPVIAPEVTRTRDSYTTRGGEVIFPRFGASKFLGYPGLKDFQISVYSDWIVFEYASAEPLSSEQEVEIEEEMGFQFAGDLPVKLKRVEQSELFSHWKRRTFYVIDGPYLESQRQAQ